MDKKRLLREDWETLMPEAVELAKRELKRRVGGRARVLPDGYDAESVTAEAIADVLRFAGTEKYRPHHAHNKNQPANGNNSPRLFHLSGILDRPYEKATKKHRSSTSRLQTLVLAQT